MKSLLRTLAPLLALALALPAVAEVDLPALGEPANQALSPRQEAAIGRQLMTQARQRLDLNRDPEIAQYIDGLGQRLASYSEPRPIDGYTFFVVRAPTINAFAGPGGYIGVHSGLVTAATTEAQLAGVLAHEIAHVSQRHIARSIARSERSNYTTLAAVLAGLIIGSQNPQAGQAAITGGIAAGQQQRINYTRSNEYEADRIGIALLARADFDPGGMTRFFETLMRASGPGGSQVPEFLRTHPLSETRLSEAASRAAGLARPEQRRDSLEFQLIKARMQALYDSQPGVLHDRWTRSERSEGDVATARQYGLAVLERRLDRHAAARERLEPLFAAAPSNLHYGLELARVEQAAGRGEKALDTWEEVRTFHPASYPTVAVGSDLLIANDRADRAVALVTEYLRGDAPAPPDAWRQLAQAAEAAGRPVRSHEALGEYYVRVGRLGQALTQFELALEQARPDTPEQLRLEARTEQVRELRREQLARNPLGG